MLDRDIKIDLRTITGTTGPWNKPTFSDEHKVFGKKVETSAEEKSRADSEGEVNIVRVDVNEENYNGETYAYINGNEDLKKIYKSVAVKNKIYLYLSDAKTAEEDDKPDDPE